MGACFAKPKTRSLLIDTLQQYSHVTCRSYPLRHPVCTARKYYLGIAIIRFADCFWLDVPTVVSHPAGYIDTGDDSMMNAIQIPLVILQKGSSLASKPPSIAPTVSLLLEALTMWSARVTHISSDHVLTIASSGSEAIRSAK
jgi:hypothetical protein